MSEKGTHGTHHASTRPKRGIGNNDRFKKVSHREWCQVKYVTFGAYVRLHKPLLLHVPLMLTRWSALLHNPYPDGDKTKRRIDGIDHRACNMGPNTINHYSKWPQWYKDPYSIPWIGGVMIFYPHFAQNVFFLFKFWYMLDHTPPYTFFGKNT